MCNSTVTIEHKDSTLARHTRLCHVNDASTQTRVLGRKQV